MTREPFPDLARHAGFVRSLARALVADEATADDLVQDVWVRALERPPRHGRQLRAWLARVARNLAANRWRGDERRRAREQPLAQLVRERAALHELVLAERLADSDMVSRCVTRQWFRYAFGRNEAEPDTWEVVKS